MVSLVSGSLVPGSRGLGVSLTEPGVSLCRSIRRRYLSRVEKKFDLIQVFPVLEIASTLSRKNRDISSRVNQLKGFVRRRNQTMIRQSNFLKVGEDFNLLRAGKDADF